MSLVRQSPVFHFITTVCLAQLVRYQSTMWESLIWFWAGINLVPRAAPTHTLGKSPGSEFELEQHSGFWNNLGGGAALL